MPLYKITTRSTFENNYLILADSLDIAESIVMDDTEMPDFYQKHISEIIIQAESVSDDTKAERRKLRDEGYI